MTDLSRVIQSLPALELDVPSYAVSRNWPRDFFREHRLAYGIEEAAHNRRATNLTSYYIKL